MTFDLQSLLWVCLTAVQADRLCHLEAAAAAAVLEDQVPFCVSSRRRRIILRRP